MFDVVKEMRTLSNLSYERLCEIAVKERSPVGIQRPSKVEIITAIIAGRVLDHVSWRDDFAQRMANKSNPRTKYRLEDQYNNSYYLELTEDQESFFTWCYNNNIDILNSELTEMDNNIEWEAP